MKILISNPSKQHTHQLVKALFTADNNVVFATSFWLKEKSIFNWASKFSNKIRGQVNKKSHAEIPDKNVKLSFLGVATFFIIRFFKGEQTRSFINDRVQDYWVSKYINKFKPDIFIGYEKSALSSFSKVKKYGGICILDLAATHVNFIELLRNEYPFYKKSTGSDRLFKKVKSVKLAEYKEADYIIVLSQFAKQTLLNNAIDSKKIHVLNLGFETKLFLPKQNYLVNRNSPLKLLYVGQVNTRKGLLLLVQLMEELQNYDIQLTIVGPYGDAVEYLKHKKNITYTSFLSHSLLADEMRNADVFVFPTYMDSWGMVVLEAMACGLPVIVTENCGSKEVVNNNSGFIIPVNSINSLKEKVLFFYNNLEAIESMGNFARKAAIEFTWQNYYTNAIKLVSELQNTNSCN